jgi:hypothetical protein
MKEPKKKHAGRPLHPGSREVEPPTPKRSEQVPAGDDSDINEGRDYDLEKDVDRQISSSDPDDDRGVAP